MENRPLFQICERVVYRNVSVDVTEVHFEYVTNQFVYDIIYDDGESRDKVAQDELQKTIPHLSFQLSKTFVPFHRKTVFYSYFECVWLFFRWIGTILWTAISNWCDKLRWKIFVRIARGHTKARNSPNSVNSVAKATIQCWLVLYNIRYIIINFLWMFFS